ncbi:hypothetical protein LCM20_00980 [Halobacillus litoralis]|uniref:hypothetical protein n=1 Tax=Halobacillus litoralis TaxID=45668 RepID=UPI001CD5B5F8|nr:hypothetical protein [Halobacillus litoralis]MCA0969158.1 hypothetical protein [Halobacillus litoralis]
MNSIISSLGKMAASQSVQPKSGQVLKGKVVEMMPGNRAVIQVGKQQVQAQLEAPLTKGKAYVFQVMGKEEGMMRLKVVSQAQTGEKLDVQALLQRLGMKATKHNVDVIKALLKSDTPFQTSDVKTALSLLQKSEQKPVAKQVLIEMIQKQLPVKPAVFQALMSQKMHQVTSLMQKIETIETPRTMGDQKVQALIQNLKGAPPALSKIESSVAKILTEASAKNPTSFQLFQKAGLISPNQTFDQFQKIWSQWSEAGARSSSPAASGNESITPKQLTQMVQQSSNQPPLPASINQMTDALKQLFDRQLPVTKGEQQALSRWTEQLSRYVQPESRANSTPALTDQSRQKWLNDHQLLQKKNTVQKLMPLLPESTKSAVQQVTRQVPQIIEGTQPVTNSIRQAAEALRQLQSSQLTQNQRASLTEWVSRLASDFSPQIKDSMLMKLKAMVDLSGIQDEAVMRQAVQANETLVKEASVKSLLLQSMQDPETQIRPETARQMVSLLNGIQLSAHSETQQSINLSLQFPGDLVGATEDIQMNMDGRKTKDGEIDPDYCHIVFFLNLENFEETVVDLNIVDRRVAVTVYNHYDVDPSVNTFKPNLEEGLKELGYQLSSLQSRPFRSDASQEQKATMEEEDGEEGVDIRI